MIKIRNEGRISFDIVWFLMKRIILFLSLIALKVGVVVILYDSSQKFGEKYVLRAPSGDDEEELLDNVLNRLIIGLFWYTIVQ